MRRASALLVVLAFGTTPPLIAQSDSTRSTSITAPTFHAGQWAAQFGLGNGFYGIGVLRHRSPNSAWALNGSFRVSHSTYDPGNTRGNFNNAFLSIGRRVYRAGSGRVRPFREAGLLTSYDWGSNSGGSYDQKRQSFGGGVYGQVGAMVFFAPELGLGASFNASATYIHQHQESTGSPLPNSSTQDYFSIDAGRVNLVGAFYF